MDDPRTVLATLLSISRSAAPEVDARAEPVVVVAETLALLRKNGVRVHVEENPRRGRVAQPARRPRPVGGLFHPTC